MCGLHEQARRTGSGGVLQSAWLFLFFCANSRATYSLRSISSLRPMMTQLGLPSPRCWGCPSPHNAKVWPASHLLQVVWVAFINEVKGPSPLGQLGRQPEDDPAPAPCCGRHHDQVSFRLLRLPPLQCSSCMPRRSPCSGIRCS